MGVLRFSRYTHFYSMLLLAHNLNINGYIKQKYIMVNKILKSKRKNKTLDLQAQYYECEDFITFLIEKWQLGYSIISYYLELSVTERYKVIHYLITERPCNSWQNIVLYLLNPNSKRNNGNRQ